MYNGSCSSEGKSRSKYIIFIAFMPYLIKNRKQKSAVSYRAEVARKLRASNK